MQAVETEETKDHQYAEDALPDEADDTMLHELT